MAEDEKRTIPQNRKGWPMWTDISEQLTWYGHKLIPEHWKELLSIDWSEHNGRVKAVPTISGNGIAYLGVSTSQMKKLEFSELIECTYAFGDSNGVKWSEPALKAYEQYREAQQ